MSDNAGLEDNSAAAGQQEADSCQTDKNQTQTPSNANSHEELESPLAKHKISSSPVNGSFMSTPALIRQSTEKSDNHPRETTATTTKPRKRRSTTKSELTSTPPPRRSRRRMSEKAEDEMTISPTDNNNPAPNRANDAAQNHTSAKSHTTRTKSPSPSINSIDIRSSKRKHSEVEEIINISTATHDEDNQISPRSMAPVGPPAKRRRKSQAMKSTTSTASTRFSKRKASLSEQSNSLPVLSDHEEEAPPRSRSSRSAEANLVTAFENQRHHFDFHFDSRIGIDSLHSDNPSKLKNKSHDESRPLNAKTDGSDVDEVVDEEDDGEGISGAKPSKLRKHSDSLSANGPRVSPRRSIDSEPNRQELDDDVEDGSSLSAKLFKFRTTWQTSSAAHKRKSIETADRDTEDVVGEGARALRKSSLISSKSNSMLSSLAQAHNGGGGGESSTSAPRNSKRRASEMDENDDASVYRDASEKPSREVDGDDEHPTKKLRSLSISSSRSLPIRAPEIIVDRASEDTSVIDEPDAQNDVGTPPVKRRGRPAGGRPPLSRENSKQQKKSKPGRKGFPGRRKRTSENAKVQAAYDRMSDLRKKYKEIAKGLKPALAVIADQSIEAMLADPKAHEKVPEFLIVKQGLNSAHNSYLATLEASHQVKVNYIKKQRDDLCEYADRKFAFAYQDILDRTIARAKEAFRTTYEAGFKELAEDEDNMTVDENRDTHLRDLNAFAEPEDADQSFAVSASVDQAGTSTPRGKKSPIKKRSQNTSTPSGPPPRSIAIAKHSLLSAEQEPEPSSVPPSRAASAEPPDSMIFDEYGVHLPNRVRRGRMTEPNNRAIVQPWFQFEPHEIMYDIFISKRKNKPGPDAIYFDQASITNPSGESYKLGECRPDDFDEELVKRHKLHPKYGIPCKNSVNPDDVVPRTDFSKPLKRTRPIVVVDVEATRPQSPGGTRKAAELSEPHELSRSASIVYGVSDWEDFLVHRRMERELGPDGYPSVKGFATYDAEKRSLQRFADSMEEILDAAKDLEEKEAKEAKAKAAAAAANIAHKSSIHAIVNSDDSSGPASHVNKQGRRNSTSRRRSSPPVFGSGLDAISEAIKIRQGQNGLPPRGYFYGPHTRDYGNQSRQYVPQPPPRTYIQQPTPIPQQNPMPQQSAPYNTGAHPQPQQPIQILQPSAPPYATASPQMQHQMMQTLHPRPLGPMTHSPYYNQHHAAPVMPPPPPPGPPPPPANRPYTQFHSFVPPQPQRPAEQPYQMGGQSSSRQHRELRPAPPQAGSEWATRSTQDAGHSYGHPSPLPTYQAGVAQPQQGQPQQPPPHQGQAHPAPSHPNQSHPAQPHAGQPHPGPPHQAPSHPAQSHPAQPHPAQPHHVQPHPGQSHQPQTHQTQPHQGPPHQMQAHQPPPPAPYATQSPYSWPQPPGPPPHVMQPQVSQGIHSGIPQGVSVSGVSGVSLPPPGPPVGVQFPPPQPSPVQQHQALHGGPGPNPHNAPHSYGPPPPTVTENVNSFTAINASGSHSSSHSAHGHGAAAANSGGGAEEFHDESSARRKGGNSHGHGHSHGHSHGHGHGGGQVGHGTKRGGRPRKVP